MNRFQGFGGLMRIFFLVVLLSVGAVQPMEPAAHAAGIFEGIGKGLDGLFMGLLSLPGKIFESLFGNTKVAVVCDCKDSKCKKPEPCKQAGTPSEKGLFDDIFPASLPSTLAPKSKTAPAPVNHIGGAY